MRTLATYVVLLVSTLVLGLVVIVADLFGARKGPGTIFERAPKLWARGLLRASGVRVALHGADRMGAGAARIFLVNHVSWFDVLALAAYLPRYSFVAKAEIFRVPVFGRGARAVNTIAIQRENRKAAFGAYEEAADRIRGGDSVIVFPEGTRGTTYALRSFKKGPFVLAIAAEVPIVPVIVHGTIEVNPRGSLSVRPGRVDVHFLEPIETDGLTYDDRDRLARQVYERMAEAMERLYGVRSPGYGDPAPPPPVPAAQS